VAICEGACRGTDSSGVVESFLPGPVLCARWFYAVSRRGAPASSGLHSRRWNSTRPFLQGGSQVDVSRFFTGATRCSPATTWSICRSTANGWVVLPFRFIAQPDSDIALPCNSDPRAHRAGFGAGLREAVCGPHEPCLQKAQSAGCVDLKADDSGWLRSHSTCPSYGLGQSVFPRPRCCTKPRGYVGPEFWEQWAYRRAHLGLTNLNAYRFRDPGADHDGGVTWI